MYGETITVNGKQMIPAMSLSSRIRYTDIVPKVLQERSEGVFIPNSNYGGKWFFPIDILGRWEAEMS